MVKRERLLHVTLGPVQVKEQLLWCFPLPLGRGSSLSYAALFNINNTTYRILYLPFSKSLQMPLANHPDVVGTSVLRTS